MPPQSRVKSVSGIIELLKIRRQHENNRSSGGMSWESTVNYYRAINQRDGDRETRSRYGQNSVTKLHQTATRHTHCYCLNLKHIANKHSAQSKQQGNESAKARQLTEGKRINTAERIIQHNKPKLRNV